MYHIYAQDWPNGKTSLHKNLGDLAAFSAERAPDTSWRKPIAEPRDVSADETLLAKLEGVSGIVWAN